jgi:hypothetical protein
MAATTTIDVPSEAIATAPIKLKSHADPAVAAKCNALVLAGLGEKTFYPGDETYETRNAKYWSLDAQKTPWCIVQPSTPEEVSAAVTAIVATDGCNFAIRSGGHVMWGASNIDNGITIDLGRLNSTTYDAQTKLVSVGPGARWADVYAVIEPLGVMISGGRDGDVGVGGLLTGGGISWYSPRFGWACDSVVNAQVVLADGSIVNANKSENSDLWHALKGGSGNFGIVTRFDIQSFEAAPIYGGILTSSADTNEAQIQAIINFNTGMNVGHNSSYAAVWQYLPTLGGIVVNRFIANTMGQRGTPELNETLSIPTIAGEMGDLTMTGMAVMSEQPYGYYDFWHTITVKNDPAIIRKAVELHESTVNQLLTAGGSEVGNFTTMTLVQGMPRILKTISDERGGNVMGLDTYLSEDLQLLMFSLNIGDPALADLGRELAIKWRDDTADYAKSVGGFIPWQYLNYADKTQDPLAYVGQENFDTILATAKKYDPNGVFQTRCPGGWKITATTPK